MPNGVSARRYPRTECKNPDCGIVFQPHDRRQEYCDPQCRINANNDRRRFVNDTVFMDEKIARRNSKILDFLWHKNLRHKIITRGMLEFENFEFDGACRTTENPKTGCSIRWFHNYGLEQFKSAENIYRLHKIQYNHQ